MKINCCICQPKPTYLWWMWMVDTWEKRGNNCIYLISTRSSKNMLCPQKRDGNYRWIWNFRTLHSWLINKIIKRNQVYNLISWEVEHHAVVQRKALWKKAGYESVFKLRPPHQHLNSFKYGKKECSKEPFSFLAISTLFSYTVLHIKHLQQNAVK